MSFEPLDYLRHILDEVEYVLGHSVDTRKEQFMADDTLRRAFIRSLLILAP